MKLKLKQGITLTQEQCIEIGQSVMQKPDMGWDAEYDADYVKPMKPKVYECILDGEHGKYHYRVNISFELITLLEVS